MKQKQREIRCISFILPNAIYVLLFISALSCLPKVVLGIEFISGLDVFFLGMLIAEAKSRC